jgi:hypothetical protein
MTTFDGAGATTSLTPINSFNGLIFSFI